MQRAAGLSNGQGHIHSFRGKRRVERRIFKGRFTRLYGGVWQGQYAGLGQGLPFCLGLFKGRATIGNFKRRVDLGFDHDFSLNIKTWLIARAVKAKIHFI